MKKKLFLTALILVLAVGMMSACGGNGGGSNSEFSSNTEFRELYSSDVSTLNYLNTTTTADMGIPANCEECLIEYDTLGNIKPALAKSWKYSDDGMTWTFTLRDDVKWINNEAEEMADLKADDFVCAAQYALSEDSSGSYMYPAAKIKGAQALLDGEGTFQDVGVKAVDDHTLQFTLEAPCPYFLSCLTYGCFVPISGECLKQISDWDARDSWDADAWDAFSETLDGITYDKLWYCGAFYLNEYNAGENYTMIKNKNYWDADNVFITKISGTYNVEAANISSEMFKRGELDSASLTSTLAKSWSEDDATKDLFHPDRVQPDYSYFYCFNFDPQFDAEYEPDNWKIAVNNENFRQSIFHGLNRVGAIRIMDENNTEELIQNTITPRQFVMADGVDYPDQEVFKKLFVHPDRMDVYFDEDLAKEYRDKAKEEMKAQGAHFPVKILLVYNPNVPDWDAECLYVENQLEELLGKDYIDIIVEQGPTQSFLSNVRRIGKYALLKCNYGCDYADPLTYADPFSDGNNYAFMYRSEDPDTKALFSTYKDAVAKADAITDPDKTKERYAAFAEAEAMLIEHATVIPFQLTCGYVASTLDVFSGEYAPYGVCTLKYKGQHILKKPMNTEEFNKALAKWKKDRAQ